MPIDLYQEKIVELKMKKKNLHIIKEVLPGSIAEECGMEPGDAIIKINGEEIQDILDYRYMVQDEDVLSYALFEQVALKFFEYRKAKMYGLDDNADAALGVHNA